MESTRADVIVVGGGTMGTAAGWALARRGHSVIVLEQFGHIHKLGSHGGHTRIFRHAYFEGPAYVPWTVESDKAWVELQERTGIDLMVRCGCLDLAAPGQDGARNAGESAAMFNLPYEMLTAAEVNERFPAWDLPADWEGCLDPDAGILLVNPTLRALTQELKAAGGRIVDNTRVLGWESGPDGVTVQTSNGTFAGDRLIVTAGPWAGKLLADLGLPLEPVRKPVMWFDVDDNEKHGSAMFPAFIAHLEQDNFYGLPGHGSDTVKIGDHSSREPIDPDDFNREVGTPDLTPRLADFLTECLPGVQHRFNNTAMCIYTMTPDEDFVIDRHPADDRIAFAAGFSGHGYKFAPVIGELLADLVTDERAETLQHFRVNRFDTIASQGD